MDSSSSTGASPSYATSAMYGPNSDDQPDFKSLSLNDHKSISLSADDCKSSGILTVLDKTSAGCLLAFKLMDAAVDDRERYDILSKHDFSLESLASIISLRATDSNGVLAALDIGLRDLTIEGSFGEETCSLKLSNVLGIFHRLSALFAKASASRLSSRLTSGAALGEELSRALADVNDLSEETKLTFDEQNSIKFCPLIGRVVLEVDGAQSSIPLKMMQELAFLFNQEFIKAVCPLIGEESSVTGLMQGINRLYIGRCVLGLAKSMRQQRYNESRHQRELARLVCLVRSPGSVFYTAPVL